LALNTRIRRQRLTQSALNLTAAGLIDIAILIAGAVSLATASAPAFEWLLVLMVTRPMLAFVLVLSDVPASG
jgi:hypothetical protein